MHESSYIPHVRHFLHTQRKFPRDWPVPGNVVSLAVLWLHFRTSFTLFTSVLTLFSTKPFTLVMEFSICISQPALKILDPLSHADIPVKFARNMSRSMTKPTKWRAPSEDSDQPVHLLSLIRSFAVRMMKHWALNSLLSAQWTLIRLGRCPGWSESSLGAQVIVLVLSCAVGGPHV